MNREQLSDEQLMQAVADGDRERYGELIRRYDRRLMAFLLRMVGDLHRAEDLLQEVLLAIWNGRKRYQKPRPFRGWVYGIAINQCRAEARRKRPVPLGDVAENQSSEASPDAQAETAEHRRIVIAAVGQLSADQREVVVLRLYEQMAYAQIATIVDRPEGTVRSVMFHALARLRRELSPILKISG